jgi:hypothetical protein
MFKRASVDLSPQTVLRLERLFPAEAQERARQLLMVECGSNLPFFEGSDSVDLERVRYAALKVSEGQLEKLREAIELAKVDWRDLLVTAGFAHDPGAHKTWLA